MDVNPFMAIENYLSPLCTTKKTRWIKRKEKKTRRHYCRQKETNLYNIIQTSSFLKEFGALVFQDTGNKEDRNR